ncbi:MFS transporter [Pseudonocardia acaciae]|uniref:MFS transporter n=1 Tax=Pseudonocardia acaciae TaxID=551276 RepID=UPI00048B8EDF|nr:MFS transporter [Pseudonocardia acaciae]
MAFDRGLRARLGWYGYDWANSVFTTAVTSIFFGPFITEVGERAAGADGYLHPLGVPVPAGSLFPYLVAFSVFVQLFALPTAAALTTRYGRGTLLGALSSCGAGATIGLYAIGEADYALGGALYVVATMALGASITVTSLVGTYAVIGLGLSGNEVVTIVLFVQLVAFGGAVLVGRLAERYGGRSVLLGVVVVWVGVIAVGAVVPDRSFGAFGAVCAGAGVVIGGTYALSRSVFVRLVPPDRAAEYLGIFETVNRCLGFVGPATFGLVLQWTGNYRAAWASILAFWLAGLCALVAGAAARREAVRHG